MDILFAQPEISSSPFEDAKIILFILHLIWNGNVIIHFIQ